MYFVWSWYPFSVVLKGQHVFFGGGPKRKAHPFGCAGWPVFGVIHSPALNESRAFLFPYLQDSGNPSDPSYIIQKVIVCLMGFRCPCGFQKATSKLVLKGCVLFPCLFFEVLFEGTNRITGTLPCDRPIDLSLHSRTPRFWRRFL